MRQSLSLSRRLLSWTTWTTGLFAFCRSMQFDLLNPDKTTRVPLTTDGGSKAGRSRENLSSIDGRGIVEAYTKPHLLLDFGNSPPTGLVESDRQRLRSFRPNHRPPGFQPGNQKIQVLHVVSLRSQKAILSLLQLYRSCTEPCGVATAASKSV